MVNEMSVDEISVA